MAVTLANCNLFTSGRRTLEQDVVLDGDRIVYVGPSGMMAHEGERLDLSGRWLAPGMIDLQVNGAGGALFQTNRDVDSLVQMEQALRALGVTGFLPTLTVSSDELTLVAAEAVGAHIANGAPGVLGINLEGPFINGSKAGMANGEECRAFDPELVREVARRVAPGKVYMTVAPESVDPAVGGLGGLGVTFAIGHTTATYDDTRGFFDRGVGVATHIFNAMTGISGRDPGVAGATLDDDKVCASLIADGYHVHPANVRLAFARLGPDRLFLISDGMPPLGSDVKEFQYGPHRITEKEGRCTTSDGVLAGTAVGLGQALTHCAQWLDCDIARLLPLVTTTPARALGITGIGEIREGCVANLVVTDSDLTVDSVIVGGDISPLR